MQSFYDAVSERNKKVALNYNIRLENIEHNAMKKESYTFLNCTIMLKKMIIL